MVFSRKFGGTYFFFLFINIIIIIIIIIIFIIIISLSILFYDIQTSVSPEQTHGIGFRIETKWCFQESLGVIFFFFFFFFF